MLNPEQIDIATELVSIKIMIGLILSVVPQQDLESISTRLQSMHDCMKDQPVADAAVQRAALFVAGLPAEKQPKNMRDILKIIPGGKIDS